MKIKNNNFWINTRKIFGFFLVFVIFYGAASEDIAFKAWKSSNEKLFLSYIWTKQTGKTRIPEGSRILIDYSELLKVMDPFDTSFSGKIKRQLYFRYFPRLNIFLKQIDLDGPRLGVERLTRKKKYKSLQSLGREELDKIRIDDFSKHKDFMDKYGISYYICPFTDWRDKREKLIPLGFNMLYNNARFILFSLKEKENIKE